MISRFRGALLGTALGDVLGAPFEGHPAPGDIDLDALAGRLNELRYTDDTHMTLALAESLVDRGGFDGRHLAETFMRYYEAEPWRGYGSGPPQIFRMIREGIAWDEAAGTLFGGSGSYGNGAAMRVAPVGLIAYRDLEQVRRLADRQSRITHTHELGREGAVLQAMAVAMLVMQPGMDANTLRGEILARLEEHTEVPIYRVKLGLVRTLLPDAPVTEVARHIGNGISAHEAVPAALYAFLRSPDSFRETVQFAIRLGGDTDTIAAMAGALSGAYLGEDSIPAPWREGVDGARELVGLADGLLSLAG